MENHICRADHGKILSNFEELHLWYQQWIQGTNDSIRTIHELLLFQWKRKPRPISFEMKGQDVESGTAIMAFDCKRASDMLHGKIIADGSAAVPDEVERCRETTTGEKVVKEVVKCALGLPC